MSMDKKDSDIRLIIVLTLVCAISGAVLTAVAKLTEEPIKNSEKIEKVEAVKAVLPEFVNNPDEDKKEVEFTENNKTIKRTIYPAKDKDGKPVGYAVLSSSEKGYGGMIEIMLGVLPDGTIKTFKLVKQSETPGLGTKTGEPGFQEQFTGKSLDNFQFKVKKDGGDVDAVTAATISSRAVTEAIETGLKAVKKFQE